MLCFTRVLFKHLTEYLTAAQLSTLLKADAPDSGAQDIQNGTGMHQARIAIGCTWNGQWPVASDTHISFADWILAYVHRRSKALTVADFDPSSAGAAASWITWVSAPALSLFDQCICNIPLLASAKSCHTLLANNAAALHPHILAADDLVLPTNAELTFSSD